MSWADLPAKPFVAFVTPLHAVLPRQISLSCRSCVYAQCWKITSKASVQARPRSHVLRCSSKHVGEDGSVSNPSLGSTQGLADHKPTIQSAVSAAPGSNFYLGAAVALAAAAAITPALCSTLQAASPAAHATALPPDYASHYIMLAAVAAFGLAHSGLASLRPAAAAVMGERLFRVLFALVSLPSAVATIAYFIAHRYDGIQLWRLQGVPGVHELCYALAFVSFLLLYPATFNLLEVAAVQRPGFRMYETGVTRITRHPQLWGQVMWCIAHCAWLGTSLSVVASLALISHHCFAVWNGDRRLKDRYGVDWDAYAARTSVLPFRALLDGRQKFQWSEYSIQTYGGVLIFILAAYAAHPSMLRAVASLHW